MSRPIADEFVIVAGRLNFSPSRNAIASGEEDSMKHIAIAVGLLMLLLSVSAVAQAPAPKPGPEQEKLDVWIGEWSIQAQAKDSPSEPEYKLAWTLQARQILAGFFLEMHHAWKSQGSEATSLEIIWYDRGKKHITSYGFGSDGVTWNAVTTIKDGTIVGSGTNLSAEGKPIMKWRNTFTFSPDRMSFSLKGEQEKDGTWWTSMTGKGTKTKAVAKSQ